MIAEHSDSARATPTPKTCPMLNKLCQRELSEEAYFIYANKHFCEWKLRTGPYVDQIQYTKNCDINVVEIMPQNKEQ